LGGILLGLNRVGLNAKHRRASLGKLAGRVTASAANLYSG
jgi:hypothetical protein